MNPVILSVAVAAAATGITLPAAVGTAWILERTKLPGRGVLHTLVLLPLVLPPVVTGYLLLKVFAPRGPLGFLEVAFHFSGAVVAAAVAGFPILVMYAALALKAVDPRLETVSRSLGRSPWQTFWRVTMPLAWPGLLAGSVLAFARGLGEFGATIVLAGRIPGETETLALAVYAELDAVGGESRIGGLVLFSVAICLVSVISYRAMDSAYRRRLELER